MAVLMPLKDQSAVELLQNNLAAKGGHYLLGANMHWHGGMHFTINKSVQAIADGKLIAYRLSTDYITADLPNTGNNANKYSNSFALIQHEAKVKGRTLNYYSLYMHLMPASGYKAVPDMAIPDFIRALEGSDREASISTTEDSPKGLNIRHLETGEIVTTAPKFSEISLDESIYPESEAADFRIKETSNSNYKKVFFVDHTGSRHNGYALLDAMRVKQESDKYIVITREDPLTPSTAVGLKGLNLRSEKNYLSNTIIQVLKKDTKIKIKTLDRVWAEVKEINGAAPFSTAFISYRDKIKFDKNDIDEARLDSIHCPNQLVNAGDLLGYPGLNFSQSNSLHFEIFTDDSIINFIKDHDDIELSDKNILQVNKGSKLFQRVRVDLPKAIQTIKKYSRIKIEDNDTYHSASGEYVKITATDDCCVILKNHMKAYDSNTNEYKGIKSNLSQYKINLGRSDLVADSRLKFLHYSDANGDVESKLLSTGYRFVAFPIADTEQVTYWVKRDLINSREITTNGQDKRRILLDDLDDLYPIKFIFHEESALGSSDEILVDLPTCKSSKDSDDKIWYEVSLPFDDKGLLHYLFVHFGVNRTAQVKGWVRESDTALTTALNWPGFKIAKEEGQGNQDAKIDFTNLTPFFKELFEDIDTSSDGSINAQEMKAALKDGILADRLSRVIAKHPSEWQTDASLSKWQYLKEIVPNDAVFEEAKTQIKNLTWWDDAKTAGADLPVSTSVYHLHPMTFLHQISLVTTQLVSFVQLSEIMTGANSETINKFLIPLNKTLELFEINTPLRIAHFLAQIAHETASLLYMEEGGSGSQYENRADLGNTQLGDGKRFKGRGLLQLTGRANYTKCEVYLKTTPDYQDLDITSSIENACKVSEDIEMACLVSGYYWRYIKRKLNAVADQDNLFWVSVYVNGWAVQRHPFYPERDKEPNHMKERSNKLKIAKQVLGIINED